MKRDRLLTLDEEVAACRAICESETDCVAFAVTESHQFICTTFTRCDDRSGTSSLYSSRYWYRADVPNNGVPTLGYRMDCTPNQCTCENGDGATGAECPTHDDAKCASCDEYYHLLNDQCVANQCTCANGIGASGADCPTHDDAKCTSCADWFHLNGTACVANQCTCADGTGATGADCPADGDAVCALRHRISPGRYGVRGKPVHMRGRHRCHGRELSDRRRHQVRLLRRRILLTQRPVCLKPVHMR